ncbi:carbohydrate ABC transporter permease [Clostridium polynesiense]|uniref:carbohydrate ABC transporter permease n=1 Tax=Clostridium polynesiense TaxID=1325933 RepID=UPI00058C84BC|nr:carbohydrate ABC transporter permease [Clostridium polynesiense]
MISRNKKIALFFVSVILGIIIIFPILYALSISFMDQGEIFQYPPKIFPGSFRLDNYRKVLSTAPIFKFIINSLIVSSAVTLGQIITASLAAYAFAFYDFKGKKAIFIAILATMMIPGEAIIIANYLSIASWNWIDSYQGLIVPYLTSAMGIFMMRQYYLTIPKELREASIIDGCSSFKFLTKIVIPLSRPIVGALGIYVFLMTWNQYMWPLLVTNGPHKRTVQIGISMLQFAEAQSYGIIMAGIVMILIPSIFIFIAGQEQLIKGMTSGAVKG